MGYQEARRDQQRGSDDRGPDIHLVSLTRGVVGEENSSLVSQLKLLRHDSNARLDAIKRSMDSYLAQQSENDSKALVEALREVVRDFNAKINDQFGDNFRHLNEGVGKRLT